jgi:FAD-dependent oxidoreductase domain-containing protein 1
MDCDILVIGSGIFGVTSAYYIKKNNPDRDVILVDSKGSAGQGNTGRSNGMFRNTFTSIDNQILSNSSIDFYLGIQSSGTDLGIQQIGYLWLLDDEKVSKFSKSIEKMKENNIDIRLLSVKELESIINFVASPNSEESRLLDLKPVSVGVFGPKCGRLAPEKLVDFYLEGFKSMGGKTIFNCNINRIIVSALKELKIDGEPFVWQSWRFSSAKTEGDEMQFDFDDIVLACGAWVNFLVEPLGLDFQVKSKKRQIFSLSAKRNEELLSLMKTKGFNKLELLPMVILPVAGIHFKPVLESEEFWVSCEDEINREFINIPGEISTYNPEPEYFRSNIYPVLREYFPQFTNPVIKNMWAGLYAYHLPDCLPFVEREANMIVIGGDSGSGIMKADSLGRIVDALYRGEEYAVLFGGFHYPVSRISIKRRKVESEEWVI